MHDYIEQEYVKTFCRHSSLADEFFSDKKEELCNKYEYVEVLRHPCVTINGQIHCRQTFIAKVPFED